jgi:hypothetical protein
VVVGAPSRYNDPELKSVLPRWQPLGFDAENGLEQVATVFGDVEVEAWDEPRVSLARTADVVLFLRGCRLAEDHARAAAERFETPSTGTAAATLTIAACTSSPPGTSRWLIANLGDSPVWQSSGDRLDRLSEEHNLAAELVRWGVLSPANSRDHPGRHTITRALAMAEEVHLSTICEAPAIATGQNVSGEIGRWLARTGILDPDLPDGAQS